MRRTTSLLVGLMIALAFHNGCENEQPFSPLAASDDYFPMQVGNRWTYTLAYSTGAYTLEYEIVGTEMVGSHEYFVFERKFDLAVTTDTVYYRSDGDNRIFINFQGENVLYIDFNRTEGQSWQTYGEYIATIEKADFQAEVPAGFFEHSVEVFFNYPSAVDDEVWEVYAPGVGLVEIRGFIGVIQLQSAEVNGVEIK
jgi:hypothetical protein